MSKITSEMLARFFENRTTAAENDVIADWIESDPENQNIFNRELQFHLMLLNISSGYMKHAPHKAKRNIFGSRSSIFLSAAAMLAGILLTWFIGVAPLKNEASGILTFTTQPGQRASLTLPDGTSVHLNSGSTLEYPAVFSRKERRVRLEGEAMFDVESKARRPFYVETFAYDVKVLGTRFNVLAEKEKEEFSTALIEGSVAILDKRNESLVATMTPDQEIVLSDGRLYKRTVEDIANRYRWTEGIIDCSGMSFDDLMRKFEKSFGIEIVNELDTLPQINIRRMKVNVKDGVSHALELLQRNAEFSYRYDDTTDTYYLYD